MFGNACLVQTVEEARAQTAATLPLRTAHTTSHVTVHLLPSDFSFLRSPRADATEDDADCLGAAAAHGTGRGRGREIGRERGGEYRDHKIAGGGGTEGAKEGEGRGGGDSFLDDHGHQRDLFQSSFRSGDFDHDHDQDLATGRGRDRFYDYDYATSAAAVSCSVGTDMFRTAASEVLGHRYLSARSVSQDEETFKRGNDRHLVNDHLKCSSNAQEKSADAFQSSYMTAKECEEDEDCKTGRSTTFSERANFRRHY